ncbi:hypothetical protein V5O48_010755 [Marasmius crinis-equi]|uniref:Transcription factor domain-containing protein n=1 Tax=Marasmius crinis-equi TaxID=585013 RepID=A0ABR3F7W8_9AGAR
MYFLILSLLSDSDQRESESCLSRALFQVSNTLSSPHPKKIIHSIQAEVLIANYFFLANRMLEGKYHLNTAVSLAAGARLQTLRPWGASTLPSSSVDPVERGETINAFWMVYSMHNLWDTLGPTTAVFDREDQSIELPWPMDMANYEQILEDGDPEAAKGRSTVRDFLSGASIGSSGNGSSLLAKCTRACILFSHANSLANASASGKVNRILLDPHNDASLEMISSTGQLRNLSTILDCFYSELPPLDLESSPSDLHTTASVHMLTHAAMIRVHEGIDIVKYHNKSLATARTAIGLLPAVNTLRQHSSDVVRAPVLTPVFGMLWGIIGRVLLREMGRLRQSWSRPAMVWARLRETEKMLVELMTSMERFSGHSPFMAYQLEKLREAMNY